MEFLLSICPLICGFSSSRTSLLASRISSGAPVLPVEWLDRTIYEKETSTAANLVTHEADISILASALALNLAIVSGNKHLHTRSVRDRVKTFRPREFARAETY